MENTYFIVNDNDNSIIGEVNTILSRNDTAKHLDELREKWYENDECMTLLEYLMTYAPSEFMNISEMEINNKNSIRI